MMDIYVKLNGQICGPYSETEIINRISSGQISESDLARRDGLEEWVPMSKLLSIGPKAIDSPPLLKVSEIVPPLAASSETKKSDEKSKPVENNSTISPILGSILLFVLWRYRHFFVNLENNIHLQHAFLIIGVVVMFLIGGLGIFGSIANRKHLSLLQWIGLIFLFIAGGFGLVEFITLGFED